MVACDGQTRYKCLSCGSPLSETNSKKYCGSKCRAKFNNESRIRKLNELKSDDQLVECALCGGKFGSLPYHLKKHGITSSEYTKLFPDLKIVSKHYSMLASEKIKGDKNPGYQHGGKLSPWSKNSIVHTEGQIIRSKKKAIDNYTKDKRWNTMEYYISKGMDYEQAKSAQSDAQRTFSLQKCIDKYGEEEGKRIHKDRQERWQKTLMSKSPQEIAEINKKKAHSLGATSNIEKQFRDRLASFFPDLRGTQQVTPTINVDVMLNDHVIEFFGDFWHISPEKYVDTYVNPVTKMSAMEQWRKDDNRINELTNLGYKIKVVWEHEYIGDSERIIRECVEFLNNAIR